MYETLDNYLEHYGVKGMRWGVRKDRFKVGKIKIYKNISRKSNPRKYKPNSILDHYKEDGVLDARSFYNEKGIKFKDIHATNHGNPKFHKIPHVDDFYWYKNGKIKMKRIRNELTKDELEHYKEMKNINDKK